MKPDRARILARPADEEVIDCENVEDAVVNPPRHASHEGLVWQ